MRRPEKGGRATDRKPWAFAPGRRRALTGLFLHPAEAWLVLETIGWMAILPILKHAVRLPSLVRFMWRAGDGRARNPHREARVVNLVRGLTRRSGGNCLERSLILYRLLSRENTHPQLVMGIAQRPDGSGHAWIVIDGAPLLETADTLNAYTELMRFGHGGDQLTPREVAAAT